eukprot:8656957-Alexandrium_andersonii.AAC.1
MLGLSLPGARGEDCAGIAATTLSQLTNSLRPCGLQTQSAAKVDRTEDLMPERELLRQLTVIAPT